MANLVKVKMDSTLEWDIPSSGYGFVEFWDESGRRWWYCKNNQRREMSRQEIAILQAKFIAAEGFIDTDKAHFIEGEPIYGSDAYQASDLESMWANREIAEAAWY